jgi:hypothetical protein
MMILKGRRMEEEPRKEMNNFSLNLYKLINHINSIISIIKKNITLIPIIQEHKSINILNLKYRILM